MHHAIVALAIVTIFSSNTLAQHVIAHRGASYDAPENTLASFRLAWEEGADGIEGDFRLTADGEVVCIHDEDTERVSGKKLNVKDSTLDELKRLEVGTWKDPKYRGEKIPTLTEVLAELPDGKLILIEIKCGPEIIAPLTEVLGASAVEANQVVIICFDAEVIAESKRRMPQYKTQWLTRFKRIRDSWSPSPEEVATAIESCGADALGAQAETRCIDQGYVNQLEKLGVCEFGVWTVNDLETARKYQSWGAWSITTDRPGWMRDQLGW